MIKWASLGNNAQSRLEQRPIRISPFLKWVYSDRMLRVLYGFRKGADGGRSRGANGVRRCPGEMGSPVHIRDRSLISETTAEDAVLPVLFGFLRSESASRRKYGSQIEQKWAQKFQ